MDAYIKIKEISHALRFTPHTSEILKCNVTMLKLSGSCLYALITFNCQTDVMYIYIYTCLRIIIFNCVCGTQCHTMRWCNFNCLLSSMFTISNTLFLQNFLTAYWSCKMSILGCSDQCLKPRLYQYVVALSKTLNPHRFSRLSDQCLKPRLYQYVVSLRKTLNPHRFSRLSDQCLKP